MKPTIELKLPVNPEFVALLRHVSGAAAVRSDLTVNLLDDSKIACSEAAILLINNAIENSDFTWAWYCHDKQLDVQASVPTLLQEVPDFGSMEGFTWTVLSAVAKSLGVTLIEGNLVITFSITESG